MKITCLKILVLLLLFTQLAGCAGYRYGSSKALAQERYLLIEPSGTSFGNQRFSEFLDYHHNLKGFVGSYGTPDFFYEYKNEENRPSVRLFYVEENMVYVYESLSWRPSSMFLKNQRPLTDYEFATYRELNPQSDMIL